MTEEETTDIAEKWMAIADTDGSGTMTWVHTVTCRSGQDPSLWPLKFWAPSPELTLPLLGSIGTIDD